jgi:beta-mannosidase
MLRSCSDIIVKFGWDWGPAFVPSGIHKPAYFVTVPSAQSSDKNLSNSVSVWAEETSIEIYKEGQKPSIEPNASADWVVNVTLGLRAASDVTPSMTISFPELGLDSPPLPLGLISGGLDKPTFVSATFKIPNGVPELWYPQNLGNPKRYNTTVQLSPGDLSVTKTTGFRTIVLHQEPYTQAEIDQRGITPGDKFFFTINGKPFYTSGTNVIPFDPFYPRISTTYVSTKTESAESYHETHIGIIRLGGSLRVPSSLDRIWSGFFSTCSF